MPFAKDDIEGIVKCSLQKLRRLDKHLLDININERTITHKLAKYSLGDQVLFLLIDLKINY